MKYTHWKMPKVFGMMIQKLVSIGQLTVEYDSMRTFFQKETGVLE